MAFGIDDAIGIASAWASLAGGRERNSQAADTAQRANEFSAQQYATRYQTTVKDMQAAGLSPMLAYSQGPGSAPQGQQAQFTDAVTPAVSAGSAARLQSAQRDVLEAQAEQARAAAEASSAQAAKTRAETPFVDPLAQANIGHLESSAASNFQNIEQSKATVTKINTEVDQILAQTGLTKEMTKGQALENLNKVEAGKVLVATAKQLYSQFVLNMEKAKSEPVARAQMSSSMRLMAAQGLNLRVLAEKTGGVDTLRSEIEASLAKIELKGAESFGSIGTDTKYLKPFLELLWNATRR